MRIFAFHPASLLKPLIKPQPMHPFTAWAAQKDQVVIRFGKTKSTCDGLAGVDMYPVLPGKEAYAHIEEHMRGYWDAFSQTTGKPGQYTERDVSRLYAQLTHAPESLKIIGFRDSLTGQLISGGILNLDRDSEIEFPKEDRRNKGYLNHIWTKNGYEGHGLATRVIQQLCREARARGLEVLQLCVENRRAARLYRHLGFKTVCRMENSGGREDIMEKVLA